MRKKVLMDTLKSHFSTSCPASSADVIVLMGRGDIQEKPQCTTMVHCGHILAAAEDSPRTIEWLNARSRGYKSLLLSRPLPCFQISGTPLLSRRGGSDE